MIINLGRKGVTGVKEQSDSLQIPQQPFVRTVTWEIPDATFIVIQEGNTLKHKYKLT
jgi:hypothetical protein